MRTSAFTPLRSLKRTQTHSTQMKPSQRANATGKFPEVLLLRSPQEKHEQAVQISPENSLTPALTDEAPTRQQALTKRPRAP